jgi:hypothetical protein
MASLKGQSRAEVNLEAEAALAEVGPHPNLRCHRLPIRLDSRPTIFGQEEAAKILLEPVINFGRAS